MRVLIAGLALAVAVSGTPAFAQAPATRIAAPAPTTAGAPLDPASLALAQQILAIAFPPEKRTQMFASVLDSVVDQTRKAMGSDKFTSDKDFQALLNRSTQRMFDAMKTVLTAQEPDVFDSMARGYARMFSQDDLTQILAFVRTPAGQHYFERATDILKDPDVQAANQRMLAVLMAKLPEITRQNMQDVEDYVAKKEKQSARTTHAS